METSELNERSAEEVMSQLDALSQSAEGELEEESGSEEEEESQLSLKPETQADELDKPVFAEETPRHHPKIIFNVTDAQYPVVKHVGKKVFKWKLSTDPNRDWDICWIDKTVPIETLAKMQPYQKINHFPGIQSIARKNNLGRNLMKMYKMYPKNYNFFPITYLLPLDYHDFKSQFSKSKKNATFIVKPEASSQGRGIFLTRSLDNINPKEKFVAQKYIKSPYLIDGLKFDLRIYVLLAGCDPLRCYIYEDGLGRFATEPYAKPTNENLSSTCMHLTNYAINKENPNFVFNNNSEADDVGHKKSLKAVFKLLEAEGHDTKALWEEIKRIILKTFCSVQPLLAHYYRSCHANEPYNNMCFEILGFDIMLDKRLKPWLIEVNHLPSFTTDTPLDESIKKNVITDALKIMNISPQNKIDYKNKKKEEFHHKAMSRKAKFNLEEKRNAIEKAQRERDEWEAKNHGGYQKIYPLDDDAECDEDYVEFMKAAGQHWQTWIGADVKKDSSKAAAKAEETQATESEAQTNKRSNGSPTRRKQCVSPKHSSNTQTKKGFSGKAASSTATKQDKVTDRETHLGPWGEVRSTEDSDVHFMGSSKKRNKVIEESEDERGHLANYKNIAHLSKSALSFPKLRDHSEESSVAGSSLTQRDIGSTNILSDGNSGNHSERIQNIQKGFSKQKVNVYGTTPKKPVNKIESQTGTKQVRPDTSSKKAVQTSSQKEKEDSKKPALKRIVNPNRRSAGGMQSTDFRGGKEMHSLRKGSSKRGLELDLEDQSEPVTPLKSPYNRVLSPKRDINNQPEKTLERVRSQDRFNPKASPIRELRKKLERETSKEKSKDLNDVSASKPPTQKPKKKKDTKQKNNEENDKKPQRITLYLSKEALTNPPVVSADQENKRVWPAGNALLKVDDTKSATKIDQISCNLLSPQYYKVKLGRDSSPVKVYEMKPNYMPKNKPKIDLFQKKGSFLPESETSQSKLSSVLTKDWSVESNPKDFRLSPKMRKVQSNNFFK